MEGKERGEYLISLFWKEPDIALRVEIIRLLEKQMTGFLSSFLFYGKRIRVIKKKRQSFDGRRSGFSSLESERILPFFFRLIEKEDFPSELKEEVDELLSLRFFCVFLLIHYDKLGKSFLSRNSSFCSVGKRRWECCKYAHKMSNDRDKKVRNLSQTILWGEGEISHLTLQEEDLNSRLIRVLANEKGVNLLIQMGEKDPLLEEQILNLWAKQRTSHLPLVLKKSLKKGSGDRFLLCFLPEEENIEIVFSFGLPGRSFTSRKKKFLLSVKKI